MTSEDLAVPSLRRGAAARLASLVARTGFALVTAVITARLLGPASKGTLSTLLFVVTVLSFLASLGLGDAAVVEVGSGRATLQRALSATLPPLLGSAAAGVVAIAVVAKIADWGSIAGAVGLAMATLVVTTFAYVLTGFLNALERVPLVALSWAVSGAVTAAATALLVGVLKLDIAGGVAAAGLGATAMLTVLLLALRAAGVRFVASRDRAYLGRALRFGALNESTFVLSVLAERADLLLVYAVLGEGPAGAYVVALTVGRLSVFAATSIAGATFPRLARVTRDEARTIIGMSARVSVVFAAGSGVGLVAVTPVAIDVLFGPAYRDAVAPAILTALAGPVVGLQIALARAAAARGFPRASLWSFLVSISVMLGLDVVLLPTLALVGAAIASMVGATCGAIAAAVTLRRAALLRLGDLVPTTDDLRAIARGLRGTTGTAA